MRIKPFTDFPENVAAYGEVTDEAGVRKYDLNIDNVHAGMVIATIKGIDDRTTAEGLKGLRLYVLKSALPRPAEDEFYHADLLGLDAMENGN